MMIFALIIVCLIIYGLLGWCWADALLCLDESTSHYRQSYLFSLFLWPLSMILWDTYKQEDDYND